MKKLFKKNQLMITVLALMIAVAGYLKFTGSTLDEDDYQADADSIISMEGLDISDEDALLTDAGDIESLDSEVVVVSDQYLDEDMAELLGEDLSGYLGSTTTDPLVGNSFVDSTSGNLDLTTANQGDLTAEQLAVNNENAGTDSFAANQENTVVDDIPGEAVFTSTAGISVISGAKLEKEQIRSKNKDALMEIINNVNIAEEQKQGAINNMVAMTDVAEKEVSAQILLEAKGFADVVVSINDASCDVMVALVELTPQQCAQIMDIVSRKTGIAAENIIITPVGNE